MGKRLINLETGEPTQYVEGSTLYNPEFWELVEGEYTDEMMMNEGIDELLEEKNILDIIDNG